jgi:hypothetical protein
MHRWDYSVERLMTADEPPGDKLKALRAVDAKVEKWLQAKGGEGWELIHIQGGYETGIVGLFKREILQ